MSGNVRCRVCKEFIQESDIVAITRIYSIAHVACDPAGLGEGIEKEGVFRILMDEYKSSN